MIIQCEKCQTRFRLDDSRVTEKGVKVRCTRCKYVFTVRKEEPVADTLFPEVALTDSSPPIPADESPAAPPEEWSFTAQSDQTPAADDQPVAAPEDEWSFAAQALPTPVAESFESDAFEMSGTERGETSAPVTTSAAEFDFSDEEMCGSVVQSAPETQPDTISFDFEGDRFTETVDTNGQDSSSTTDTQPTFDAPAEAPFSLGDIDFGDELPPAAVPEVNQEELKSSPEILAVSLVEPTAKSDDDKLTQSFFEETTADEQQELPPLSIPSRRKQSPVFGVLIAVIALLVISVLGYFGYSSLSTPKGTAPSESGKISVRAIKGAFVKNSAAGDLLVVSGEACNEYSKPRASLQVKVTVTDATGQIVATKNAYGGNPLTNAQLETLPLDKIEAAMANPFGDSLANMGVAPGKSIPFVVVLAHIPEGAKNFSVQSAGSTVATGK